MSRQRGTPAEPNSRHEPSFLPTSRDRWILVGIGLVALLLRVIYCMQAKGANPVFDAPFMDAGMHDLWAKKIASGQGYGPEPYFRAPLYYYLLAGVFKVFGHSYDAARVLQALVGASSCVVIGLLGWRLSGRTCGYIAASLAAVYWPFVYFDGELLTTNIEVFLAVSILLLCLRTKETGKLSDWLLLGGLFGLAALARPNVLVFLPFAAGWIWMGRRSLANGPHAWQGATALVVACVLTLTPTTVRNATVGKDPVLIATSGGVNLYIGNNPQANGFMAIVPGTRASWEGGYQDTHKIVEAALGRKPKESEVSSYWTQEALKWISKNPGAWLKLTIEKLRLLAHVVEIPNNQPDEFFFRLAPLGHMLLPIGFPLIAALAACGLWTERTRLREWTPVLLYFATYSLTLLAFFVNGRFRQPLMPVLILFAAAALASLIEATKAKKYAQAAISVGVAVAAFILLTLVSHDRTTFEKYSEAEGHYIIGFTEANKARANRSSPKDAIAHLRIATDLRPTDAQAWLYLGMALSVANENKEAEEALLRSKQLNPADPDVDRMLQYVQSQLNPGPAKAARLEAEASEKAKVGQFEEAARLLVQATELDPTIVRTWSNLAVTYRRLQQYVPAAQAMERVLELDPSRLSTIVTLAHLYSTSPDAKARNGKRALALAEPLATTQATAPVVWDVLALAHAELQDWSHAKSAIAKAVSLIEKAPTDPMAERIHAHQASIQSQKPVREK